MFICNHCLKNYKNFAIPFSYGTCEDCGKQGVCADILSSQLEYIEPWKPTTETGDFNPKTRLNNKKFT